MVPDMTVTDTVAKLKAHLAQRGIGTEMAQRSKKFARTVLRNNIAFLRANSSAGTTSCIIGATIGVVGNARMSRSASL